MRKSLRFVMLIVVITLSAMTIQTQSSRDRLESTIQVKRLLETRNRLLSSAVGRTKAAAGLGFRKPMVKALSLDVNSGSQYYAFIDALGDTPGSYGFYQVWPGQDYYKSVFATSDDINGGGAVYDGKFHGTSWDYSFTGTYHEYTLPDWTPTENDGKKVYNPAYWGMSSAYDPVDGKVYLCSMDPDTYEYILALYQGGSRRQCSC